MKQIHEKTKRVGEQKREYDEFGTNATLKMRRCTGRNPESRYRHHDQRRDTSSWKSVPSDVTERRDKTVGKRAIHRMETPF
jgi:hypothetical protein